jgi:hypothetical protein
MRLFRTFVVLTSESTKFGDRDDDSGITASHSLKRKAGDLEGEGPQTKITRVQAWVQPDDVVDDAMLTGSDPQDWTELNGETLQGVIWGSAVCIPCAAPIHLP